MIDDVLVARFLEAKEAEATAKAHRLALETEIFEQSLGEKLEGSETESSSDGRFKITITRKLTRKLDYKAYQEIENSLPATLRFVTYKPEIDLKILRAVELVDPSLSAMCITTAPAKPSIKITNMED